MAGFDDVKMGVCKVVVNPDAVAPATTTTIDKTKGGVKLKVVQKTSPVTIDQTGETPIKKITMGLDATIAAPIAVSDLDTIKMAYPGNATKVTDATSGTSAVIVDAKAGIDTLQFAVPVRIEPVGGTVADHVTFVRAVAEANLDQTYELDGVRVVDVVFTGFPDPDNGYRTVIFGDNAIVV